VLAAGLADVLVRDPDPLVLGRVLGHLLDQLPVLLLDVGVVVEPALDVLQPDRERIADLLQLVDGEQPGAAHSGNAELDPLSGKGRAEQPRELELHRGDLPPQIGARGALVVLVEDRVEALGGRGRNKGLIDLGLNEHLGKVRSFE
jgi:hypothetical protein